MTVKTSAKIGAKLKMRNFVQFLRIGSLRKNYNHKLGGFS